MTIPGARLGTSAATAAALLLASWAAALAEPRPAAPDRVDTATLAAQAISTTTAPGPRPNAPASAPDRTRQADGRATGHAADRATGQATGRATGQATRQATDQATDRAADLAPPAIGGSGRRYLVVYKQGRHAGAASPERLGVRTRHRFDGVIDGYAATLTAAQLLTVRSDPAVDHVAPDRRVHATGTQSPATDWGLDRLDQRTLPLDDSYTYPYDGTGVTAYVIDTGLRSTHGDFAGRVGTGRNFAVHTPAGQPDDPNATVDPADTADCNGHGTHVAGSLGGTTYGVAKNVAIVPVRALDCNGSGYTSDVINAVQWVTTNHSGPSVANMSLGGDTLDPDLDAAIQASIDAGVTYAVAAGNGDANGNPLNACTQSPGDLPAAITVGASDSDDTAASFSNYGTCVDLYAPGTSIVSDWNTSDNATASLDGTSMATPHVAGLAALFLQAHPGSTPAQLRDYLVGYGIHGVLTRMLPGDPNVLAHVPHDDEAPSITAIGRQVSGLNVTATVTASDPASGLHGFSYAWSTRPTATTTEIDTVEDGTSPTLSATVAQGLWYLHIRAQDSDGNWSGVANSAAFVVDVTAPRLTGLRVRPAAPTRFAVTVGASDNVGLASVHVVWNRSRASLSGGHQIVGGPATVISPALARGTWYVHVIAVDRAGHTSAWTTAGPYASPQPFVRGAVTQGARCATSVRGSFGFTRSHVLERCSRSATSALLRWRPY